MDASEARHQEQDARPAPTDEQRAARGREILAAMHPSQRRDEEGSDGRAVGLEEWKAPMFDVGTMAA
jgi:hypothetical protein